MNTSLGLSMRRIYHTWWPLAASWLLMGAELPALSAIVARLPEPEINLAAYGGVVFPLALIIEAPVIMLLAASTALSKDWDSYRKIWRFMMITGGACTALHVLIAFTPLYYIVVEKIIDAPTEIIEPARIGFMIMIPWTWSIAYRRFNQGVLIRFGHSQTITIGTMIRLSADLSVLSAGYLLGLPGIVVATSAVAAGVMSEALYVGIVVRPVIRTQVIPAAKVTPPLTLKAFLTFYIPLALTSLLTLLANPMGSAAISRMPLAIPSLAVWPVLSGLVFMVRALGIAFNEVVVALLDEANSYHNLLRFTRILALITTAMLLILAVTPLSTLWFEQVSALPTQLVELAQAALWITLPLPALSFVQSWYQGAILHGKRTRVITEAVIVYLLTSAIILSVGVIWGRITGLYIGMFALTASVFTQTVWLWLRSRGVMRDIRQRDEQSATPSVVEATII